MPAFWALSYDLFVERCTEDISTNKLLGTEVQVSVLWIENIVTRLIGYNQILKGM